MAQPNIIIYLSLICIPIFIYLEIKKKLRKWAAEKEAISDRQRILFLETNLRYYINEGQHDLPHLESILDHSRQDQKAKGTKAQ